MKWSCSTLAGLDLWWPYLSHWYWISRAWQTFSKWKCFSLPAIAFWPGQSFKYLPWDCSFSLLKWMRMLSSGVHKTSVFKVRGNYLLFSVEKFYRRKMNWTVGHTWLCVQIRNCCSGDTAKPRLSDTFLICIPDLALQGKEDTYGSRSSWIYEKAHKQSSFHTNPISNAGNAKWICPWWYWAHTLRPVNTRHKEDIGWKIEDEVKDRWHTWWREWKNGWEIILCFN